ncbi:MAG: hypothetical protein KGJ13_05770 [Patescibacteria group bacterium]|nr:hypothetical protein [Patescibacteria group bacterium]
MDTILGNVGSQLAIIFNIGNTPGNIPIVSATAASPIVLTVADNDFANGDYVSVVGCNEEADGIWKVSAATSTTLALTGSTGEVTTVGTGAIVSKCLDCTGGTITFTTKNTAWTVGNSILMASTTLSTNTLALDAPAFAWGASLANGQVIDAATGQKAGLFTLTLTAAQMTAFGAGRSIYGRIFFNDASNIPSEQWRFAITIT